MKELLIKKVGPIEAAFVLAILENAKNKNEVIMEITGFPEHPANTAHFAANMSNITFSHIEGNTVHYTCNKSHRPKGWIRKTLSREFINIACRNNNYDDAKWAAKQLDMTVAELKEKYHYVQVEEMLAVDHLHEVCVFKDSCTIEDWLKD